MGSSGALGCMNPEGHGNCSAASRRSASLRTTCASSSAAWATKLEEDRRRTSAARSEGGCLVRTGNASGLEPEQAEVSPAQIQGLLASLPEPSRSLAWLLVLTGLRIGELLALRWRDVDLSLGVLHVRRTLYEGRFDEPKSKRSRRTVPLAPKGVEILSARKPGVVQPEALVFGTALGTPLDRHNLRNRQLQPAAERLKLERIGWHWLRHAHATLLDAVGTPLGTVQALLGHSSSEITREVYLHSIPSDARGAVQKVENLLIGPKSDPSSAMPKMRSTLVH